MTVGGIRSSAPLTPSDLPSTNVVDGKLAELRRQESVLRDGNTETFRADLKTLGLVGGGIALATGLASGLLAARPGASLSSSARLGALVGSGSGMVAAAAMTMFGDTGGTSDIDDELDALRSARSALATERRPVAEVVDMGVTPFNVVTSKVLAAYDHDDDGSVDLREGQAIDVDERITAGNGPGPVQDDSEFVHSVATVLRPADARGDGNGLADAREIATYLLDASQDDDELRQTIEIDGDRDHDRLEPLYWMHTHYLGNGRGWGDASEFRPEG